MEGYESLYAKTRMLQSDNSIGNLMMNEDDNHSWRAFLIDLDFAIKEQREESSGAGSKTATRVFMAIDVLVGKKHSFMHDLDSWSHFFGCYFGFASTTVSQMRGVGVVSTFENWNYTDTEVLAKQKLGTIADEAIFIKTISSSSILI